MDDILLQRRIDELTERVGILESAEALASTDKSQLESYLNQITSRHTAFIGQVSAGDYSMLASSKNDYISLQCRKRILRGDEADYREQIDALNNEILSLNAILSAEPSDVRIQEAGYFVSVVDGYEGLLNFDRIYSLTKEDIEGIIREPQLEVGEGIIGKMIDGYKWRFVGVLDTERTRSLYEGMTVEFRTGGNTQLVKATILRRIRLDDGNTIFIFECDTLTPEFASRRVSQFSLMLDNFRGIRIPTAAVHLNEDNRQGVFVRRGSELVFCRINVIRTESDYFLVEDTTNVAGYISLYDSVVVRGRDLYDGKIVP
jgi:putative membrane fusion protein